MASILYLHLLYYHLGKGKRWTDHCASFFCPRRRAPPPRPPPRSSFPRFLSYPLVLPSRDVSRRTRWWWWCEMVVVALDFSLARPLFGWLIVVATLEESPLSRVVSWSFLLLLRVRWWQGSWSSTPWLPLHSTSIPRTIVPSYTPRGGTRKSITNENSPSLLKEFATPSSSTLPAARRVEVRPHIPFHGAPRDGVTRITVERKSETWVDYTNSGNDPSRALQRCPLLLLIPSLFRFSRTPLHPPRPPPRRVDDPQSHLLASWRADKVLAYDVDLPSLFFPRH